MQDFTYRAMEKHYELKGFEYTQDMADCQVRNITDLNEYIDAINQDRYTILVSTRYDMDLCMDDDVINAFAKLGLKAL